jgi:hypothetical protein
MKAGVISYGLVYEFIMQKTSEIDANFVIYTTFLNQLQNPYHSDVFLCWCSVIADLKAFKLSSLRPSFMKTTPKFW